MSCSLMTAARREDGSAGISSSLRAVPGIPAARGCRTPHGCSRVSSAFVNANLCGKTPAVINSRDRTTPAAFLFQGSSSELIAELA